MPSYSGMGFTNCGGGMIWLLQNWKIIACVLLAGGLFVSGWVRGSASVQAEWDAEKLATAQAHIAAMEANQKLINKLEVQKNENLAKVADLSRELRTLRVRVPCSSMPTSADDGQAAGGGELSTSPQAAFDRFRQSLESDYEEADRIVEDCRVVMEWAMR